MADADSKTCRVCGLTLPYGDFRKNSTYGDGYTNHCRQCHNRLSNDRYHRTKILRPLSPTLACFHCGKEFQRPQPKRPTDPPRVSTKHCSAQCRFWSKVDKSGGPDACWPWTGALSTKGYGRFALSTGNYIQANRFSYELTYGSLGDLFACHRCDNPRCCNPAHLFPGTHQDNMRDMRQKGRDFPIASVVPLATAAKLGKPKSAETRAKISAALMGRKIPRDIVEKVSAKTRGKKRSEETKARMSLAQQRRFHPERFLVAQE